MSIVGPVEMMLVLLAVHAVCDYPLQGDFLAKAKNHKTPIPGVPWSTALSSHALIHGGGVWLVTGSWILLVVEFVAHTLIDFAKSDGRLTFNQDQSLHIACKVGYVLTLQYWVLL